jgi:hypothetical protein
VKQPALRALHNEYTRDAGFHEQIIPDNSPIQAINYPLKAVVKVKNAAGAHILGIYRCLRP